MAGEPIELKVEDSGIGMVQVDGPDGGNYTEVLNDTIEYLRFGSWSDTP